VGETGFGIPSLIAELEALRVRMADGFGKTEKRMRSLRGESEKGLIDSKESKESDTASIRNEMMQQTDGVQERLGLEITGR